MSSGKYRKEHTCLNCGHHVELHYCSSCGQPNLELKESFWGFIGHSVAHYFHFDSKFFQTLSPLLTKPGEVTQAYIAGKRARYINPVSLYIFVSIVYFLIVPAARQKHVQEEPAQANEKVTASKLDSLQKQFDSSDKTANTIVRYSLDRIETESVKKEYKKLSFNEQRSYLDSLTKIQKKSADENLADLIRSLKTLHIQKQDSTYESYLSRQKKLPEPEKDSWIKRQLKKREIRVNAKSARGDWTISEEIKKYEPKQYFLLMPLLAFFIMISFRKNHIYYLDHLIFTIHGMTAYFIVSIFCYPLIKYIFGIGSFMGQLIEFGIFVWVCWYLFNGLKVFYNRSTKATIRKMIGLFVLYGFSLYITESLIRNLIYYIIT